MGYWEIVKRVIREADIVVEVIDARFPEYSRNPQMEGMSRGAGKKLLIAINKSDLISKKRAQEVKDSIKEDAVFVSARKKSGIAILRKAIRRLGGEDKVKIAITGYPNTGKSSIINMLKGKRSAPVSSTAGFTRGMQNIKIDSRTMIIDTPGVIPVDEQDETKMVLLSAKNVQAIRDLESTGVDIAEIALKNNKAGVENYYGVKADDGEELLSRIAETRKMLKKGGFPDLNAAARVLITDFQRGTIKIKKRENHDLDA